MEVHHTAAQSILLTEDQDDQSYAGRGTAHQISQPSFQDEDITERFPRYRRFRRESELMTRLSSALEAEELWDIRSFIDNLTPIARDIVGNHEHVPGQSSFHYKIAFIVIYDFFDEHEALHDDGKASDRNIFSRLRHAAKQPDNEVQESVLYLLATFFVLAGPLIFTRPRTLKLLSHILNSTSASESNRLGDLRSLACQCLIWSFSKMVEWDIVAEPLWRNALQVVQPYLTVAVVPNLIGYLVNVDHHPLSIDDEFAGATLASVVINSLMRDDDEHKRIIAVGILRQLLYCDCTVWPYFPISLDGFSEIEALVNNAPTEYVHESLYGSFAFRELSRDEINASWKFLASTWYLFVRAEIINAAHNHTGDVKVPHDMVEMWRVLLRAVNKDRFFVGRLCNIHTAYILKVGIQKDEHGRPATSRIAQEIQLATQLWLVTSDELSVDIRTAVAETILQTLFKYRDIYDVFSGRARSEWKKLIEELVFCDPQRALLAVAKVQVNEDKRALVQQRVWTDLVHFTVLEDIKARGNRTYFSINELVAFLDFPNRVEFPCIDEYVQLLWKTLLLKAFPVAKERRKSVLILNCMKETAEKLGVRDVIWKKSDDDGVDPEVERRRKYRGAERPTETA